MGAEVINIDVSTSAVKKGETEIDTIKTLTAMQPDFITIRHSVAGFVERLAKYTNAHIVNSGDGAGSIQLRLCLIVLQSFRKSRRSRA